MASSSEGRAEEEIRTHKRDCAASKQGAEEQNTQKTHTVLSMHAELSVTPAWPGCLSVSYVTVHKVLRYKHSTDR